MAIQLKGTPAGILGRLVRGSSWNLVAVFFNQGGSLAINIVVARLLLKQGFGEFAIINSALLTAATVCQFSSGYTAARYLAEYRTSNPVAAARILALCRFVACASGGVGMCALIVAAHPLADHLLNAPYLENALRLGAPFVLFTALNGFQMGALGGLEAYSALAIAGAIGGALMIACVTTGAVLFGLSGAVAALSCGSLLRAMVHTFFLWRQCRIQGLVGGVRFEWADLRVLSRFSAPAALAGLYSMPIAWFATSMLAKRAGGFVDIAGYAAASNFKTLALLLPTTVNTVGLTILNGERSPERLLHVYRSNVMLIAACSTCSSLAVGLAGPFLLMVFGKSFAADYSVLWLLLGGAALEGINSGLYQAIHVRSRIWTSLLLINIPREAVFLIGAILFAPVYGAIGLAAAYATSSVLGTILHLYVVWLVTRSTRCVIQVASVDC